MNDIRTMIRDILREELQAIKGQQVSSAPRSETVTLNSDGDLNAFVRRIIDMARDPQQCDAIRSGRMNFRLATPQAPRPSYTPPRPATPASQSVPASPPARKVFDRGLLTERDINLLPAGTRVITVAKCVRLTPLARDEAQRLKIKIERTR